MPIDSPVRRWLILLIMFVAVPAGGATLTGVAAVPGTVTITADGPPAVAHQLALAAPLRLVVDLPAALPGPIVADGAGSITRLRLANFAPGVARLVIDLSAPLEIVVARSSATGLTLTLKRVSDLDFADAVKLGRRPLPVLAGGPVVASAPAAVPPVSPAAPVAGGGFVLPADAFARAHAGASAPSDTAATPDASVVPDPEGTPPVRHRPGIRPRSGGKPVVVIDAGHGGKDVGAISIDGRYEKDVTLAIARATAQALEKSRKIRVILTRDDDRFIPLGGRVAIARGARADLFVSIHADSAPNEDARGASVYTLSAVASDAVAARLAARENRADIIGGVNLGVQSPEIGDIMIDLSRRATGNVSVAFAETLEDALADRIRFRGEFHHFAGFYVLKAPDVPSVLLETGYVTNAEDAALLFSDSGRRRIAAGIAAAIERHLLGD